VFLTKNRHKALPGRAASDIISRFRGCGFCHAGSGQIHGSVAQPVEQRTFNPPHDEIKFVLADRADYEWAREIIRARSLARVCPVLFSPVQGELSPAQLADWILADRLPVRLQVQLHKVLWGNAPGK